MFLKKLFSHSLIYALGPQIPKIAAIFVLPLITRYLTSEDYGIYGVLTSYIGILTGVADLGFSVILVNSFYQYPKRWPIIWKQLHFYLICWSLIYSLLMALTLLITIPTNQGHQTLNIILLVCLPSLFFNSTIVLASRYYQFAQKPLYIAMTSAIVGVVAIFLNLYTIAYLKMGYMGWFLSTALATCVQFTLFVYPVFFKYKLGPIISFRKLFLLKHLKVSLPTIPHNYSSYLLNSSDRIVMDNLKVRIGEIGKFNLAYTFGNYFEFFGNAIGMAIGPFYTGIIAKGTDKSERDYHFVTHWLQYSFLLAGILLSLWSKELMDMLIKNDELRNVYPLTIIIIMGYVCRPYYWAIITRLQFKEQTKQLWKISFIAGVLNVVLNLIFVPIYGIMAAAVTTFAALLYMGFSGYYIKVVRTAVIKSYCPAIIMLAIIISTVLVYLFKDISLVSKFVITAGLIVLFLGYTWNKRTVIRAIEL